MCTTNDEMPICCIVVDSDDAGDIFNGQYIPFRIIFNSTCCNIYIMPCINVYKSLVWNLDSFRECFLYFFGEQSTKTTTDPGAESVDTESIRIL